MDDEIGSLLDLYKESSFLRDIYNKDYQNRDKQDVAFTKLSDELAIPLADINTNLNSLHAQLRRESYKINKTKSGLYHSKRLYHSNWSSKKKMPEKHYLDKKGLPLHTKPKALKKAIKKSRGKDNTIAEKIPYLFVNFSISSNSI